MRQNTAAVRSAAIQGVSDQATDAISLVVENPGLLDAIDAADAVPADRRQQRQVDTYYALILRLQINRFLRAEVEAVDRQIILRKRGRATVYDTPSFRKYWERIKENQPDDFREYMERDVFSPDILGVDYTAN